MCEQMHQIKPSAFVKLALTTFSGLILHISHTCCGWLPSLLRTVTLRLQKSWPVDFIWRSEQELSKHQHVYRHQFMQRNHTSAAGQLYSRSGFYSPGLPCGICTQCVRRHLWPHGGFVWRWILSKEEELATKTGAIPVKMHTPYIYIYIYIYKHVK